MNRQQAKEILPIMQAFAEGKTIEVRAKEVRANSSIEWVETSKPIFDRYHEYRIKPEPKYRPFANKEECWQEMLKHQPFGWVKDKNVEDDYYIIDGVYYSESFDYDVASMASGAFSYKELVDNYLFADGTPFGIKE